MGEQKIAGQDQLIRGGPTSVAQSILNAEGSSVGSGRESASCGVLDPKTISKITAKKKELTGQDDPARRGPTAKAQQHAGEPITSQALHDSTARSELAKNRGRGLKDD